MISDNGKLYRERFAKKALGSGWYSFDKKGVHFIGLVNVLNLREGGLGITRRRTTRMAQERSGAALIKHAYCGVRAHSAVGGLSAVGLGNRRHRTGARIPETIRIRHGVERHIHQIVQKVEGNITFHTAMSTAFPQPAPGTAPKPGPMKVEAERLSSVLGITDVNYVEGNHTLAVVDSTLA